MKFVVCVCKETFGLPDAYVNAVAGTAKKMFMCPCCIKRYGVGASIKLETNVEAILLVTDTSKPPDQITGNRAQTFAAWNAVGGSLLK